MTGLLTLAELARRADIHLGPVTISPSTRAVRGPAGAANLEPRAMQVLLVLAEADGRVVTRDELFRRCWGASMVGDDSLNRAVADVRRAVRAAAPGLLEIATVPRTGYRLVVGAPADAEAEPSSATTLRTTRRWLLGGSGVAVAVAAGGVIWLARPDPVRVRAAAIVEEAEVTRQAGAPEAHASALRLLEQATTLDPQSSPAWGKLALVTCEMVEESAPDQIASLTAQARHAARRALDLDPRQADALAALAILPPYYGDWAAAEKRLDAVLARAPAHVPTRDARAFFYVSVGRVKESYAERLAITPLEPLNATLLYRLVYGHWIMGRTEEADRAADRAMQLWPRNGAVWFARLWLFAFTGRADRALAQLDDASTRPDFPSWTLEALRASMIALTTRRAGDVEAASTRLLRQVTRGPSHAINALLLLNGMGEVDRAFQVARAYYLEEGPLMASVRWKPGQFEVRDQRRRKTHTLFVPATAPMRADPRFRELVEHIGLAQYWRSVGKWPDGPGFPRLDS